MIEEAESLTENPECTTPSHSGQDVLSSIMAAVRLETGCIGRNVIRAPWGIDFDSAALASFVGVDSKRFAIFHTVSRGSACTTVEGQPTITLGPGDVVVYPNATRHTLSDRIGRPAIPMRNLLEVAQMNMSPADAFGSSDGAETAMICGYFTYDRDGAHPLFSELPEVIHIRREDHRSGWLTQTLEFMATESAAMSPGTAAVLESLTRVLFIEVIRHVVRSADASSGWLRALGDRSIARALTAIHANADGDWSVASLAGIANMSRSVFARRFTELVGEPPLQYLTRWRIQRATRDLTLGVHSMTEIATRAGYGSEAAFSRAFKRWTGTSPGAYRRSAA